MDLNKLKNKGGLPEKKDVKRPTLMLVGGFSDFFLEALADLGFKFFIYGKERSKKNLKIDIVVIGYDETEDALSYVKQFGAVPVLFDSSKDFYNYNAQTEQGNAFVYEKDSLWHMLEAILRANETFQFTYDWKNLKAEIEDVVKYALKNVV